MSGLKLPEPVEVSTAHFDWHPTTNVTIDATGGEWAQPCGCWFGPMNGPPIICDAHRAAADGSGVPNPGECACSLSLADGVIRRCSSHEADEALR